jgi:hypothetical protein
VEPTTFAIVQNRLAAMAVMCAVRVDLQIGADPGQVFVQRLVAPEIVLVGPGEAQHVGLGKRDLVGQLARALEALFHAHDVHGEAAVIGDAVGLARLPERV